jgi:nicotinamidase/pyrazinamidase
MTYKMIDMEIDVLIIIDMINGFCRKGYPLSLQQDTKSIEEYIATRIKCIEAMKGQVIFCCDSHTPDAPELKQYPPHCMKGTIEAEIIETLKPFIKNSKVVHKNTLSLFYKTKLDNLLKKIQPRKIEVVGVCTDICDLFAVYELRNRGYEVFVSHKGVLPLEIDKQIDNLNYFTSKLGAEVELPSNL